nr:RNA polymerase sigma factor [uncultured Caproiciproducens sp.]
MGKQLRHPDDHLSEKYDLYGNMLFKLCMVILCNREDAEDVVQDTFAKYLQKCPEFHSLEHEKAWFIRVAANGSRDKRRRFFFRKTVSLEEIGEYAETSEQIEVLEQLMELPPNYKTILYLHYVEGYKIREISDILGMGENAVKVALHRGREKLKLQMREELIS